MTAHASSHRKQVRRRERCSAGFSMVEVIIALVVFMVGALTLSLVMPLATRHVVTANSQSRASELAAECAEEILVTPWDDGDLTSGAHADSTNPREGIYYVTWAVVDSVPVPNCKRVTVNVSRGTADAVALAQVVVVVPQAGALE